MHASIGKSLHLQSLLRKPAFDVLRWSFVAILLAAPGFAPAQTLARPGWAGSGMTAERWWPHAVLCEVQPDSLAGQADASSGSTLHRLQAHLADLQTLGIDAVLLRHLEPGTEAAASLSRLDSRYGSADDLDEFVSDAARHGVRVLAELPSGMQGDNLANDARFWLNHGFTGLALDSPDPSGIRTLRAVLHSYIGERVLISLSPADLLRATNADAQPDLLRVPLPPVAQGAAALRRALDQVRALSAGHAPVPLLSPEGGPGNDASANVLATALLGSGGAVLLRVDDLDLADATGMHPDSNFAWYRQWSGLHRGNPVMRGGQETLLDHDADGALVWVRQLRNGGAPIVAICNLTGEPLHLSLVDDIQRLRLRGSFLRTIARSDGGMGAMPLRAVVLPPYAVYVGELSR